MPKQTSPRVLFWAGIGCLALAVLCTVATVIGMIVSFRAVEKTSEVFDPADLANSFSVAAIPAGVAVPLAVLGIVLLFWARNPSRFAG